MDDPLTILDQTVRLPLSDRAARVGAISAAGRMVRTAALALGAPAATLAAVDDERQWIWGSHGLSEAWSERGRITPSEPWCQSVLESGRPFQVSDTSADNSLASSVAHARDGLRSFLSVPIALPDHPLRGVLAVLDKRVRSWSADELKLLSELAASAGSELALWQRLHVREESHRRLLADLSARRWAEERFRQVVEAAPNGMIMVDQEGRIVLLNAQVEKLFGYSKGQLLGQPIEILVPERYRPKHPGQRRGYFALPQARAMGAGRDLYGRRQDGSEFPVEIGLNPLPSEDGMFVLASVIDITERKRSEERLKKSEAAKAAIVNSALTCIVTMDACGNILNFNPAAERTFGYQQDDVIGRPISETLLPPRLRDRYAQELARCLATGESNLLGKRLELAALRADGTQIPVELTITTTGHGSERVFTGFLRDLTERQRAEERFQQLVEAAPNGMIMVDQQGTIVLVNAQIQRLFGYTRDELLGRPIEQLVPLRYRDRHPVLREGYFQNPHVRAMGAGRDLFGRRQDGSEFPVEIGLNPLPGDEGKFVLASVIDITERKRSEALMLKSLQEKDVLLREIHHRVKNNLQIITSLLRMQARGLSEPALVQVLRDSQDRIRSMALIHEKLYRSADLARINIADYLQDLTSSLFQSYVTPHQEIQLQTEVDALELDLDQALPCGLILNELISNCLKHAFAGRATGIISLGLRLQTDGQYRLYVRDDGVGFPLDFDPGRASTLGIRLVRTLTEQLGGSLAYGEKAGASVEVTFRPHRPA